MPETFAGAAAALADPAALIDDWLHRYERSRLRVPRALDLRQLVGPAHGIAAALAQPLAEGAGAPGTPALREAEKLFAFAGGNLGMQRGSAFDVCAFVDTLRDALVSRARGPAEAQAVALLFDWMRATAVESYASSRLDALRLRQRDSLERGTPVVMVTRDVPAAFLLGEPEREVLEAVFGRLLLAVVRAGARVVLIDGLGLMQAAAPELLAALRDFAAHPKVASLTAIVSGLAPAVEPQWLACFREGQAMAEERFEDAVARATQILRAKGP